MSLDRVFILILTFSFDPAESEKGRGEFPLAKLFNNYSTSARWI